MGTTGDAQSAAPQAAPSRGKWPHLSADLGRLAGGSAADGPLGLLAVQEERLAAERHLTDGGHARPWLGQPQAIRTRKAILMDMKLEVVVLPVCDVDRSADFYQALGWRLDADFATGPDFRVVQLTPPGSACSVIFGTGLTTAEPGSAQGIQLVVSDIDAARAELVSHGATVSEVFHDAGGVFHHAGDAARVSGPHPEHESYGSWVSFSDPDGNSWFVQEVTTRRPGRATSALAVYDSAAGLARALRRAEAAHGKHEKEIGQPDPDWPDWYAQYMVAESAGQDGQA
jgi:catechol 2,3-dioxygenase-like lactoylglutathione lyase family enzyme